VHRGSQGAQSVLENKVARPAFERLNRRLFSQGACDENERDLRGLLLRHCQGREPVECGQSVIREDYGRFELVELFDKPRLGVHTPGGELKSAFSQRMFDQGRVVNLVLDQQNSQLIFDKPVLSVKTLVCIIPTTK